MAKSPGQHDVIIVRTPEGHFRVLPAVVVVGQQVTFRNLTQYPVRVLITNGVGADVPVNLAPNSKGNVHRFDNNCPGGYWAYKVLVELSPGVTVPAQGESDPKVIVDA